MLLVPIIVIIGRVAPFLAPGKLPARGDPSLPFPGSDLTPQFAPFVKVASDALWKQGTIAFWNPFALCGAPLFETPQAGVVSLSSLLGGPLGYVTAVKLSMLVHLFAGIIGVFAFARWLGARPVFASTGSLIFGLSGFLLDHFRIGHLNLIYPMTIMPWLLLAFSRSLDSPHVLSSSVLVAGALIAIQLLEGGDSAILYEFLAMALAVLIAFAMIEPSRGRRAIFAIFITSAVAFALSAFQVVPMAGYMRLTSRASGIPLELAVHQVHESKHPFPGALALAIAGIGIVGSWRAPRHVRANVVWLGAIAVVSILVTASDAVFALLWHVVPGFSYQRIPERALLLAGVTCPVLVAHGLETMATFFRRVWNGASVRMMIIVMVGGVSLEAWLRSSGMPRMASVSEELAANSAMQWIAAHANGARMHIAETSDRNWGTEHDTVPLGLEVIAGYTPSEHRDYISGELDTMMGRRTFLETSYKNPAALWGMLDVRFLLSTIPRSVAGFHLATVAAPCSIEICQPQKSSGPYIYENERWLPRAWTVMHAVSLVGSEPEANFQAALDVLMQRWFDPATLVVIQRKPGTQIPATDLTFSTDSSLAPMPTWNRDALEEVRVLAARINRRVVAAGTVVRPNLNQIRIAGASPGWLVVSERIGLFPGWIARANGTEVPLERANGVLGAIHLQARSEIDLRYRPRGFFAGVLIFAFGTVFIVAWKTASCRRVAYKTSAIRPEPTMSI